MTKVYDYIKNNLHKTVKATHPELKPVVTPCIDAVFTTFYYWDTYFAGLAFLAVGDHNQVKNNLDNMKYMVETMGYIPNEYAPDNPCGYTNRSQPPLFARGVWDYYQYTQDENVIETYLPAIKKEYDFWQTKRQSPCGLNHYGHCATDEYLEAFYEETCERLQIDENFYPDKREQGQQFLAFAESGWDFTPRFWEADNLYAGMHYAPVDLNSILYEVECILSKFSALVGCPDEAAKYAQLAEKRKTLMEKYMLAEDGIYYDYNFVTEEHSPILSAASCMPYVVGLSDDKEVLEGIVERLDGKWGLAVCEKTGWECHNQWAYPSVWPPVCYFVYSALKKTGSKKAKAFAQKYIKLLDATYEQTGRLWEKYDAEKGGRPHGLEYDSVDMMGWTAGVYMYFLGEIE